MPSCGMLLSRVSQIQLAHFPRLLAGMLCIYGIVGCQAAAPLPAGTANPSHYSTRAGAIGMRNEAINSLQRTLPQYLVATGLLTDELESNLTGASPGVLLKASLPAGGSLDERILPGLSDVNGPDAAADAVYIDLQSVRGNVSQALGALTAYGDSTAPALRGELYALDGYTEILLADLFCSGVPLSTVDYQQDFTYAASSTTAQVYQDALIKLDSALALADTNTQLRNFGRVLQGRAWLDLGQYDSAAAAVAAVPDGFQYQLAIQWAPNTDNDQLTGVATVSDREGFNGMPFISSGDPRTTVLMTTVTITSPQSHQVTLAFPAKYNQTGFTPFPAADWIEARLIQAEAALHAGDPTTMMSLLNHLRATATVHGQTNALADTTDPGTDTARVSLLFQERAYWLFMTGHRQGDLRRLIRQYHRQQDHVYPTGPYTAPGAGQYGTDVTAAIPAKEYLNPRFHGCLNRGA